MSIAHPNESEGNRLRAELDALLGRGQNTYTPTQVVVDRASGCRLWTIDGRRLIDFASGVLVANLGHGHPGFEARFEAYRKGLPHNAYNLTTRPLVEASRRLIASFATAKAQKLLWAASGSEGIQKAMWCALHRWPERPIMLATRGGFHGKKGLAGDVTGEQSPNPNVRLVSFPLDNELSPADVERELAAIDAEFPDRGALFITEPYLGAKGSYHPPKWYHKLVQHWCEARDVAFIFDEVQSCHGRTGNLYAFQSYEVEPDLVVLGKGLANGVPAAPDAAVVGRADLIDTLDYGEASDTYSANPDTCAAVCAVLDVFAEERIVDHCRAMAPIMAQRLRGLMDRFPFVRAVRGEGLVYGVEISDADTANRCVLEAYCGDGTAGVHFLGPLAQKVLRVSPPLVITEPELDEAFALLEAAWARI
ncbi:MAG TPA: aspartate aminotransferase family protein [Candidatus Hydrogenedentes bacterium]|nr:aspartate aminotransferase family protein [Candidatus Hydrogenedentota bacterium]